MWLLDTTTLELHEFFDNSIPQYAILSHRWENEQVTFRKVLKCRAHNLGGWSKITAFCREAKRMNIKYGWVDTCCIDKKSSAELSEAINSMFRWYSNAEICLVYLNDVAVCDNWDEVRSQFRNSEWFTRGWTLQELVAPNRLLFLDRCWHVLGERFVFKDDIFQATKIDIDSLPIFYEDRFDSTLPLTKYCIATRMSWAANRVTTREEDVAYCLLGLFKVNMPLLYGEGRNKAFTRLQMNLLQRSNDRTIFGWDDRDLSYLVRPLLAPSPSCFNGMNKYTQDWQIDFRTPPSR